MKYNESRHQNSHVLIMYFSYISMLKTTCKSISQNAKSACLSKPPIDFQVQTLGTPGHVVAVLLLVLIHSLEYLSIKIITPKFTFRTEITLEIKWSIFYHSCKSNNVGVLFHAFALHNIPRSSKVQKFYFWTQLYSFSGSFTKQPILYYSLKIRVTRVVSLWGQQKLSGRLRGLEEQCSMQHGGRQKGLLSEHHHLQSPNLSVRPFIKSRETGIPGGARN